MEDHHHHHHHLFGTLNMVHEVQLVSNNMTEQLNSDPRTLKNLIQLVNRGPLKAKKTYFGNITP